MIVKGLHFQILLTLSQTSDQHIYVHSKFEDRTSNYIESTDSMIVQHVSVPCMCKLAINNNVSAQNGVMHIISFPSQNPSVMKRLKKSLTRHLIPVPSR